MGKANKKQDSLEKAMDIDPSPLPWDVVLKNDKYSTNELLIVHEQDDGYSEVICGSFMNPANAVLASHAVNNFFYMLDALTDVEADAGHHDPEGDKYIINKVTLDKVIEAIRLAEASHA